MKEDALEGDLDGGGIVRDDRELAVDNVVLDLPRPPPPPPVSALLDCTNRAGGWSRVKFGHGGVKVVHTSADDSFGDSHILNLL